MIQDDLKEEKVNEWVQKEEYKDLKFFNIKNT